MSEKLDFTLQTKCTDCMRRHVYKYETQVSYVISGHSHLVSSHLNTSLYSIDNGASVPNLFPPIRRPPYPRCPSRYTSRCRSRPYPPTSSTHYHREKHLVLLARRLHTHAQLHKAQYPRLAPPFQRLGVGNPRFGPASLLTDECGQFS